MSKQSQQGEGLQLDAPYWLAQLQTLVTETLQMARQFGADQVEVAASVSEGMSVGVRDQALETLAFTQQQGLGLTVLRGGAKGAVSITDLSAAARREAVLAALRIAEQTQPDPYAGLAEPDVMLRDIPNLDLFHPWALDTDQALQMALACEAEGLGVDRQRLQSEGAGLHSGQSVHVMGNSHGFLGGTTSTQHSLGCALIAKDAQGNKQRGGWRSSQRVSDQLQAPAEIGREAAERALRRLNPGRIATATVPVLFSAEVASGLVGHLLAAISGGNLYRGASFLRSRLDSLVFPSFVTLWEEPHLLQGAGSSAFDGDGLATREQRFIEDGNLIRFALGTYSARRLGMASTANASGLHNVRMSNTGEDFAQLLRKLDKGLWVTQLMGQGVNLVTGDYSRGASGFWVENGEVQFPVQEITIAGHLDSLFKGLLAVGSDTDRRGNIQVGSWLVESMTVAGNQ